MVKILELNKRLSERSREQFKTLVIGVDKRFNGFDITSIDPSIKVTEWDNPLETREGLITWTKYTPESIKKLTKPKDFVSFYAYDIDYNTIQMLPLANNYIILYQTKSKPGIKEVDKKVIHISETRNIMNMFITDARK